MSSGFCILNFPASLESFHWIYFPCACCALFLCYLLLWEIGHVIFTIQAFLLDIYGTRSNEGKNVERPSKPFFQQLQLVSPPPEIICVASFSDIAKNNFTMFFCCCFFCGKGGQIIRVRFFGLTLVLWKREALPKTRTKTRSSWIQSDRRHVTVVNTVVLCWDLSQINTFFSDNATPSGTYNTWFEC